MRRFKKIGNIVYWIITVVLLVIAVITASSNFRLPGNLKMLVVQSGSMEPTIKTGSIILIKKQDTYSEGDIITFLSGGNNSITHRITKTSVVKGKEKFNTKGDTNRREDGETVGIESVLGKTVFTVPYLGYLVAFTRTQRGFIFLIVVPATIIIFSEILNIKKEVLLWKEKRKSKQALPPREEKQWQYLTHD